MAKFSNKYRAFLWKKNNCWRQQQHNLENIALAQTLSYIEETLHLVQTKKLIIRTVNEKVMSNQNVDLKDIMPCNIEESDERLLLHTQHAASTFPRILIKTIDSDVIVIAIAAFHKIEEITLSCGLNLVKGRP